MSCLSTIWSSDSNQNSLPIVIVLKQCSDQMFRLVRINANTPELARLPQLLDSGQPGIQEDQDHLQYVSCTEVTPHLLA